MISRLGAALIGLTLLLDTALAVGPVYNTQSVHSGQRFVVESGYDIDQLYDGGSVGRWSTVRMRTSALLNSGFRNWSWSFSLQHTKPQGNIFYCKPDDFVFRAHPPKPSIRITLSAESPRRILSSRLWWNTDGDDVTVVGMLGRWQPLQNLSVGTEYSQGFPFSFTTDVFAHGEGGQLKWLTETSTWKYTINVTPARWWSISSDVSISDVSPVSVDAQHGLPSGYLATCEGLWRQGILRCEIGLYGIAPVTGEYREGSADLRLFGFSNGRRFAHFGKVMFSLHLWSVQWARDSLKTEIQSGSAQGDIAGTVESWPFTSGLAQFLGDRRHLVGTGALSWKSIDLSDRFHIGKPLWLLIGLKYLYLEPDVRYVTWRPLAFGFGVDDLQSGRLEIRDAHLIRLELGADISFHCWLVKLNVGQWIPVSIRKELSLSDGSNSDSGDSVLTDSSDKPYRHNGLSFSVSLSMAL